MAQHMNQFGKRWNGRRRRSRRGDDERLLPGDVVHCYQCQRRYVLDQAWMAPCCSSTCMELLRHRDPEHGKRRAYASTFREALAQRPPKRR